jgi:hypothetical protein
MSEAARKQYALAATVTAELVGAQPARHLDVVAVRLACFCMGTRLMLHARQHRAKLPDLLRGRQYGMSARADWSKFINAMQRLRAPRPVHA